MNTPELLRALSTALEMVASEAEAKMAATAGIVAQEDKDEEKPDEKEDKKAEEDKDKDEDKKETKAEDDEDDEDDAKDDKKEDKKAKSIIDMEPTMENARTVAREAIMRGVERSKVVEVLASVHAKKIADLREEKIPEFIAQVSELGNA